MRRAAARYFPRRIAVLGLLELTLSFSVIYNGIQATGIQGAGIQAVGALAPMHQVLALLPRDGITLAALLTLIIGALALTIGLYRPGVCVDRTRLLLTIGLASTVTFAILIFFGRSIDSGPALHVGEALAAWLATITLIRLVYGYAVQGVFLSRRVLLLGNPTQFLAFRARLRSRRGRFFDVVGLQGKTLSWALLRQQKIWGVVVASELDSHTSDVLLDCKVHGLPIVTDAAFHEKYLGRIDLDSLTSSHLQLGQSLTPSKVVAALTRLFDIAIAVSMLSSALPLMVMAAIAIKIDSSGPIFYRKLRVGQFGRTFTLFKFRSMTTNAEASGNPRWAQKQDPRITRVGRFIRATRVDELPQLANIILGEMSLVGPRPERPHFVEQLALAIPFYRQRTCVKPGLTGWAQVNFPYGASVEDAREKLAYDLYYVKNRSIMMDMTILISTIRVVLLREGAR